MAINFVQRNQKVLQHFPVLFVHLLLSAP
jgi:hypothetical protein